MSETRLHAPGHSSRGAGNRLATSAVLFALAGGAALVLGPVPAAPGAPASTGATTTTTTTTTARTTAVTVAARGQDEADGQSGLDAAIALLDDLDRRRITVAWDEQPLLRIVNELDVIHGVPVSADWESLDRFGADPRTLVTLRAEDTPALAVLDQLAILVGDEFERAAIESWGGRILLTTDAIAGRIVAPAVYDVRDLLAAEAGRKDPGGIGASEPTLPPNGGDAEAAEGEGDEGPAEEAGDDGSEDSASAPAVVRDRSGPGERLMRMALEHAAPETWLRFGGQSARVTERDGVLLVSASATTHRLLRTVLDSLRQADPRGMNLEATIVRVPAGVWDQLDRRYDPSQAVFGRRLLADPGATILWRSRSPVAMGGRLSIAETVAGGSVGLMLAPTVDPADQGVRLAVELSWTAASADAGGPARLVTEVPLATVGGAAAIGIPGGREPGTELVLVVLPRRF